MRVASSLLMFPRLSLSRSYSTAPNKPIIDLLARCLKEENLSHSRNAYKVRSYQIAIDAIHEHGKPIRSGQEAIKLRGIGLGIANRIDFFLQGKNYADGLDEQAKARLLAIETFQKIPGIGERTATNLVNAGAATMDDLHLPEYVSLLTPTQKVGVLYGDHMARPVPCAVAEEIAVFIRDHISKNFEVHITGAYRRESAELPEVSILLFHPQYIHVPAPRQSSTALAVLSGKAPVRTRGRQPVPFLQSASSIAQRRASSLLQDVVRPLQSVGLIAATISASPHKWRGIVALPLRVGVDTGPNTNSSLGDTWQEVGDRIRDIRAGRGKYVRLDISIAPPKSRGAAQIVLTGDEEFVRIARLAAVRQGMYLDEYGLWRWHSPEEAALEFQSGADAADADAEGRQRQPNGYWELVEGEDEDRILDEIGLGLIAPHRRNFRFLSGKKRASARAGTLDFSLAAGDTREPRRREENGDGALSDEDELPVSSAVFKPRPGDSETGEER